MAIAERSQLICRHVWRCDLEPIRKPPNPLPASGRGSRIGSWLDFFRLVIAQKPQLAALSVSTIGFRMPGSFRGVFEIQRNSEITFNSKLGQPTVDKVELSRSAIPRMQFAGEMGGVAATASHRERLGGYRKFFAKETLRVAVPVD